MSSIHLTRYNHPSQNWLDAVLALRAEFDDNGDPQPFIAFVTRRLEDETMLCVLAWEGTTPTGYALAFDVPEEPAMPEWTRAGYIAQLLVSARYRQHGVGAALMDYIDAWFLKRGLHKVLLNVNLDNAPGQAFWKKRGFEPYALRMRRVR